MSANDIAGWIAVTISLACLVAVAIMSERDKR